MAAEFQTPSINFTKVDRCASLCLHQQTTPTASPCDPSTQPRSSRSTPTSRDLDHRDHGKAQEEFPQAYGAQEGEFTWPAQLFSCRTLHHRIASREKSYANAALPPSLVRPSANRLQLPVLQPREICHCEAGQEIGDWRAGVQGLRSTLSNACQLYGCHLVPTRLCKAAHHTICGQITDPRGARQISRPK